MPLPCQENAQRVKNFAQFLTFTAILPSKGELGGSQGVESLLVFQDRHGRGGFLPSSDSTVCLQTCSPPLQQQSREKFQFGVSIRGPSSSGSGSLCKGKG